MAAPTLVATYNSVWTNTTTPKTLTPTTQAGDRVLLFASNEDASNTFGTPSGNGLTYTQVQGTTTVGNCEVFAWTATDPAGGTAWTLSLGLTGGGMFGLIAYIFRDSDGFGASSAVATGTGGPSLAVTTTQDDSAIVGCFSDWNAVDGATRTWRTINSITPTAGNGAEKNYARAASNYTTYGALWNGVGAAGSKTTGLSAPTGQKFAGVAVEVRGTAGAGPDPKPRGALVVPSVAVMRASSW